MNHFCHSLPAWLLAGVAFMVGCATPHNSTAFSDGNTPVKANEVRSANSETTTPYDPALIQAVMARWHDLVREKNTVQGKVVVEFELLMDGRVRGLRATETTVDEQQTKLCLQAIEDTSPFPRWPQSLKAQIKSDVRTVRFTFYYN